MNQNTIWYSPTYIQSSCVQLISNLGIKEIKRRHKFKDLNQSIDLSMSAFCIFAMNNTKFGLPYIQFVNDDPPDGYIIQESIDQSGNMVVTNVELSTFGFDNGISLLEQLKRDKVRPGIRKYSSEYVVIFKIIGNKEIDYEEISNYLNQQKVDFPIWTFKIVQERPDTIIDLIIINPQISRFFINTGLIANHYLESKSPDIKVHKRVSSLENINQSINPLIGAKYQNPYFGWLED